MTIKILDPHNKDAVKEIACLHKTLLPDSPVAKLGHIFMEKFYYSKLLENELILCAFYVHEQKPVGFIAYTKNAADFLSKGLRNNYTHLAGLILWSVVLKPSRIVQIIDVIKILTDSKKLKDSGETYDGEILSFGVLPEYRNLKFTSETGARISYELFDQAKDYFRDNKIAKFRMLIQQDNKEALFFYHSLGCQIKKSLVLGKPVFEISYSFE